MCHVALSLVLLIDASGSVSPAQFDRIKEAHAAAFQSRTIERAIQANPIQVATIFYGSNNHLAAPWTSLSTPHDTANFAAALSALNRPERGTTNTASGLRFALDTLEAAPCSADNHIIDLATDADRDAPSALHVQRDRAIDLGVTINIIMEPGSAHVESAVNYVQEHILTPTGFLIVVLPDDDYQTGLRRKLLMEIGYANVPTLP